MARVSGKSKKKFFVLVSQFAHGATTEGGSWEDDVLFENDSPEEVFEEALDYLRKQGYASQNKIAFCDNEGEIY